MTVTREQLEEFKRNADEMPMAEDAFPLALIADLERARKLLHELMGFEELPETYAEDIATYLEDAGIE